MVLGDGLLDGNGQQEIIYITMVSKFFPLFIAGIFLSAILAAIMSTADSQLLVTASALTKDFYHNKIRPQATEKELMWVSRGCVMGVAVIAVLIATNQNSTVLGLVSYAWGGFGSRLRSARSVLAVLEAHQQAGRLCGHPGRRHRRSGLGAAFRRHLRPV